MKKGFERFKVAAVQPRMIAGEVEQNVAAALGLVGRAVNAGARVIVLPELFMTGFDYACIAGMPQRRIESCLRELRAIARERGVVIVAGSVPTRNRGAGPGGAIYNTCHVIGRDGRTKARYRKMHLFPPMDEDAHFAAGEELVVAGTSFGKIGPCICFDIRFPEVARRLTLLGTRLLAVPAEFPRPRLDHWRTLLRARAIENQIFVVAANRVGADPTGSFFGHSMVVNPWGEVVGEADEEEGIVICLVDLRDVDSARRAIPCLDRINPALTIEESL